MGENDLFKQVEKLEKQKSDLQAELRRLKRKPRGNVGYLILILGLILLSIAIYYAHNVSAFIGIALTFWGALLLYIRPTRFIRKEILDSTLVESLKYNHKLLDELGFNGTPRYVSPGTLIGLRSATIYIPKTDLTETPVDEHLSQDEALLKDHSAIKLSPPGLGLHRLIEGELKTNFSTIDLEYLEYNLEKVLVEGLEIAEAFEMEISEPIVQANIKGNIFDVTIAEIGELEEHRHIGDPLTSALACILARSTRQSIIIKKIEREPEKKLTRIIFKMETSVIEDTNDARAREHQEKNTNN